MMSMLTILMGMVIEDTQFLENQSLKWRLVIFIFYVRLIKNTEAISIVYILIV